MERPESRRTHLDGTTYVRNVLGKPEIVFPLDGTATIENHGDGAMTIHVQKVNQTCVVQWKDARGEIYRTPCEWPTPELAKEQDNDPELKGW